MVRKILNSDTNPKDQTVKKSDKVTSHQEDKFFSWKSFIAAFILAAVLNQVLSGIVGMEPQKNIIWTTLWIYLSIEAWKHWRWKALLPYPLYSIVILIFYTIVSSAEQIELSSTHYIIVFTLNIGGLIIFYLLLRKTQQAQNIGTLE